jgi:hypothetical protein
MRFCLKLSSIILLLCIIGCSNGRIKEDKFVLVYTDLVIAQDTLGNRFLLYGLKGKVFKRYDVSEKEYNATLDYYNQDPKRWELFFTKAAAHLENLKAKKGS